jgi:hypothetical protein
MAIIVEGAPREGREGSAREGRGALRGEGRGGAAGAALAGGALAGPVTELSPARTATSGQPLVGANGATTVATKRSPLLVELTVVAFLGWIYDWLQNLAPLRRAAALRHGQAILSAEARLGLDPERALDHWLIHNHFLAYLSSDFYDNAIFGVTFTLAAWIWWRRPDIYRPLRNYLVVANLAGFTVFWLYPVAPPRMLPGFIDVVEKVGGLGSWHNTLISHADQLAAMPSMHLAWAVWCALAAWRLAPAGKWRWSAGAIGVVYCLATALDVIATANHYLADVIAGTACTAVAVAVVETSRQTLRHLKSAATATVVTSGPPRT